MRKLNGRRESERERKRKRESWLDEIFSIRKREEHNDLRSRFFCNFSHLADAPLPTRGQRIASP